MMYLAALAYSLYLIVIAGGCVALYFASWRNSWHIRIAAWVLIIGGTLGLACNFYYDWVYWRQGAFDTLVTPPSQANTSHSPVQSP